MKNSKISILIISSLLALFSFGCENSDSPLSENDHTNDLTVTSRSSDPNCDICNGIPESHCCCYVENIESTESSLDLHICGVVGSYGTAAESCSMFILHGDPCTQVNNNGVHKVITYQGKLYFCIDQNAPFSIYNANGSGHGRIRVGCSGTNMPTGSVGTDLDYGTGAYARYFETSGCAVQLPCDY